MLQCSRRLCAIALSAVLVLSLFSLWPAAGEGASESCQLSDYVNNEALAVYSDGSCRVFSYGSEGELEEGIAALQQQAEVSFVQPNYQYLIQWPFRNNSSYPGRNRPGPLWFLCGV